MSSLKPCPICGQIPRISKNEDTGDYHISCGASGRHAHEFHTVFVIALAKEVAIDAWNARAGNACTLEFNHTAKCWICSSCKSPAVVPHGNFCSNCGARIVRADEQE